MRDRARIQRIIGKLRAAWMTQPDLRLTQLIVNLHRDKRYPLFNVEDTETEKALDAYMTPEQVKS